MSDPGVATRAPASAGVLVWAGWLLVLACVLVRVQSANVPFPYWDGDPAVNFAPVLGLGPAAGLLVDVLMMLGAGVSLLGWAMSGRARGRSAGRMHIVSAVLVAIGCAGVALHAWVHSSGTLDDDRIGGMWTAAVLVGLAAAHVCGDERLRRLTFAVGIGVVMMLAAKGALQVWVEHPMTVEQYRADRESFLMSQGWAPDSIQARNFERRLNQPEATGWFGMSNVYASFAAAGMVALVGLAALGWRESRVRRTVPDGWAGLLTFGAVAAGAALLMAGGKGGFGAAGLGLLLLAGGGVWGMMKVRGSARIGGMTALAMVACALGAVAVRGMVGERIGELSLLFRWFYMQGAARIFAENPLVGVGPAGFKDAYLIAKPPISPEEVASPHSVFFDWTSSLGVLGLGWCAVLLVWVWMAGMRGARRDLKNSGMTAHSSGGLPPRSGGQPKGSFESAEERIDARLVLLLSAATMLVSAYLERPGMTLEGGIMRLVGLGAWIGISVAALAVMRRADWRWVAAVTAIVLAVHAQIEMTPVWAGASALFMLLVGCAAAPEREAGATENELDRPPRWRGGALVAASLALAAGLAWAWLGLGPIMRWEMELKRGAEAVRPLAEIRMRVEAMGAGRPLIAGDSWGRIAADVGTMLGKRGAGGPEQFDRQMHELTARAAAQAEGNLLRAAELSAWHELTVEGLVRMVLLRAAAEGELHGEERGLAAVDRAIELAERGAHERPTASAYGLLGSVQAAKAGVGDERAMQAAIDAWTRAAELDPHGLTFPLRIYRTLENLGETGTTRGIEWGERVLEADARFRLDELRQLTPEERDRVKAALERAERMP